MFIGISKRPLTSRTVHLQLEASTCVRQLLLESRSVTVSRNVHRWLEAFISVDWRLKVFIGISKLSLASRSVHITSHCLEFFLQKQHNQFLSHSVHKVAQVVKLRYKLCPFNLFSTLCYFVDTLPVLFSRRRHNRHRCPLISSPWPRLQNRT